MIEDNTLKDVPFGWAPALLTNSRLGSKNLRGTNTLAYSNIRKLRTEKSSLTFGLGKRVTRLNMPRKMTFVNIESVCLSVLLSVCL